MSKVTRGVAIGVIALAVVGAALYKSATVHAPTTWYLDPGGSDANAGTQAAPWLTLPHAITSIAPGDTVILNSGIYWLDHAQTYFLGPSGTDVQHRTTYAAAPGARVIITDTDSTPPNIHLDSYMIIRGLWFVGSWDTHTGISTTGAGDGNNPNFVLGGPMNDVVNNTFVGFGNVCCGGDYLYFAGNRSVLTGAGDLSHGLYLSGHDGTSTQEDNHAIVDNNIFIGEQTAGYLNGLGIQAWHLHHNNIITRNFVAEHIAGAAIQYDPSLGVNDRTDLVANNFWWENGLPPESYPHGFWIASGVWYINNLGGPRGGVASGDISTTTIGNTISNNAMTQGSINHLKPFAFNTSTLGPFVYTPDGTAAAEGTTLVAIDNAIAALQSSFAIGVNSVTVQSVFADTTIEPNFAALTFHTPTTSPTYNTGLNWWAQGAINIGPDIQPPNSPGAFWAAFRALGATDYGDCDQRYTAPYPAWPYPDANGNAPPYNPTCVRGTPTPTVGLSPTVTPSPTPTSAPSLTPSATLSSPPAFDDEFNGTALDSTKWSVCYPWDCHNDGNGQLTVYSPNNLYFGSGALDIQAVKQQTCDRLYCANYGSSLMQSGVPKGGVLPAKFTFQYGYVETRLQVPAGIGYFPAFWMLGQDAEIDLMEQFGAATTFSCGVHLAKYTAKWGCAPFGSNTPGSWHTFGVDWQPDHLTFYYDGAAVGGTNDPTQIPNEPMYIIADFAVGANFLAPPDLSSVFPADFRIDYVRVWASNPTPTPIPSATNTASATATTTLTVTPSPTFTATNTTTPSETPTALPTSTQTATSTDTATDTPTATPVGIDCTAGCSIGIVIHETPYTVTIK